MNQAKLQAFYLITAENEQGQGLLFFAWQGQNSVNSTPSAGPQPSSPMVPTTMLGLRAQIEEP